MKKSTKISNIDKAIETCNKEFKKAEKRAKQSNMNPMLDICTMTVYLELEMRLILEEAKLVNLQEKGQ